MIKVVTLTKKDVTAKSLADVKALMREFRGSPSKVSLPELRSIVANPLVVVSAVTENEHIVGIGFLYIIEKVGKRAAYVEDVIISRVYRGKGLGEKLMRSLIRSAKTLRVKEVYLTSRSSRVAANNLYKKLGFVLKDTNPYFLTI